MTTVTMRNRCDWCRMPATHQLSYRRANDHQQGSCDACQEHQGRLVRLLAELGGQITTTTGGIARF
jgi:hypothetical protein